jgi:hypothetical protein
LTVILCCFVLTSFALDSKIADLIENSTALDQPQKQKLKEALTPHFKLQEFEKRLTVTYMKWLTYSTNKVTVWQHDRTQNKKTEAWRSLNKFYETGLALNKAEVGLFPRGTGKADRLAKQLASQLLNQIDKTCDGNKTCTKNELAKRLCRHIPVQVRLALDHKGVKFDHAYCQRYVQTISQTSFKQSDS